MKLATALVIALAVAASPAIAAPSAFSPVRPGVAPEGLVVQVAQSLSCTPRKTCSKIRSCQEAYWYYSNCSWGGRLDGDNDGIPCESIC